MHSEKTQVNVTIVLMSVKKSNFVPQVIIVGGGFAGTEIARRLADAGGVNITLISDKSYFEYYPAFYRVVTGAVPIEVCVPLADLVPKNVDIIVDRINNIDLKNKEVTGEKGQVYKADYIVLALGSQTTYFNLPGLAEHSFGFKSIGEAVELKKHIRSLFETKKENRENVENFQIVIVGGGPSGVEVAGDMVGYLQKLADHYNIHKSFVSITLIERNSRLIPSAKPKASALVQEQLCELGVNIFLNRNVMAEDVEKILMGDMSLKTKTVIWTAGTSINELYAKTEGFKFNERKRVSVNNFLEAEGYSDIYIAGDGAGTKYSGLAQTAIHDGKFIAQDIMKKIKKQDRQSYKVKEIEYIIPVGPNWAVMSIGRFHIYGYLAYLARQTVDFLYFAKILPLKKTIELFLRGKKYR